MHVQCCCQARLKRSASGERSQAQDDESGCAGGVFLLLRLMAGRGARPGSSFEERGKSQFSRARSPSPTATRTEWPPARRDLPSDGADRDEGVDGSGGFTSSALDLRSAFAPLALVLALASVLGLDLDLACSPLALPSSLTLLFLSLPPLFPSSAPPLEERGQEGTDC